MTLELVFHADGSPLVEAVGPNRFRLHCSPEGRYGLPGAVLRTAPDVPAVELGEVRPVSADIGGELQHWLLTAWMPNIRPVREVSSVVSITPRGLTMPASVVDDSLPPRHGDSRGVVRVTWNLAFLDPTGGLGQLPCDVFLEFMGLGAERLGPVEDVGDSLLTVLRHRSAEPPLGMFAAIDFGTSSSTVALFDSREVPPRRLDPGQANELGKRLGALIVAEPVDAEAVQEWRETVSTVLREAASVPDAVAVGSAQELAEALERAAERLDVLHVVCREIDRNLRNSGDELLSWLAPRLHEAYDHAFSVPPISTVRIRPVPFRNRADIASSVWVSAVRPAPVLQMGDAPEVEGSVGIHDLKRRFSMPSSDKDRLAELAKLRGGDEAPPLAIDNIVAAAYDVLADRTEAHASFGRDGKTARLSHVVVTYPTVTTPSVIRRLRKLIEICTDVRQVTLAYDEGVAAGLYFLMRDIGGDEALGVEALRAASRPVDGTDGQWRQVMLVVDIGGGTTDIAVIGLTLRDITVTSAVNPSIAGRYYMIEPEVIGSTGHPLLGGDYLTLRVFYWLKAAVIDALIEGAPDADTRRALVGRLPAALRSDDGTPHRSLAAAVVAGATADVPAPLELMTVISDWLPTGWTDTDDDTDKNAFRSFWEVAERAKIALGGGEPFPVEKTEIENLILTIGAPHGDGSGVGAVPDRGFTLAVDAFTTLVRPAVDLAAQYAAELVGNVIASGGADGLDRVFLSGQTSKMNLVATALAAKLGEVVVRDAEGRPRRIAVSGVEVEEDYAKQAASLGACWAQSLTEYVDPNPDSPLVASGRTLVSVSVDNLHSALPCNFHRAVGGGATEQIFALGRKFEELDETGAKGVRSAWHTITPTHEILRELSVRHRVRWSHFRFAEYTEEKGFSYNRQIWEGRLATMKVQVELDQECMPRLHLCNGGAPHVVARGTPRPPGPDLLALLDDGELEQLPPIVVITGRTPTDPVVETPIFRGWRRGDGADPFTVLVHADDDPDARLIRAMVLPLPATSLRHNAYAFRVPGAEARSRLWDEWVVDGEWGPRTSYSALIGIDGSLRVFRGRLPYLRARSLVELERRAGTVLTVPVFEDQSDRTNVLWNPFTGKH